jgi:hypothetical protein
MVALVEHAFDISDQIDSVLVSFSHSRCGLSISVSFGLSQARA